MEAEFVSFAQLEWGGHKLKLVVEKEHKFFGFRKKNRANVMLVEQPKKKKKVALMNVNPVDWLMAGSWKVKSQAAKSSIRSA